MLHACALSLRDLWVAHFAELITRRSSTDASTDAQRRTGRMRTGRVHAVPPFCPRVVLFFFFLLNQSPKRTRISCVLENGGEAGASGSEVAGSRGGR